MTSRRRGCRSCECSSATSASILRTFTLVPSHEKELEMANALKDISAALRGAIQKASAFTVGLEREPYNVQRRAHRRRQGSHGESPRAGRRR